MITNANLKDYYYKSDIDFYVDTEEELRSWDLTYVYHASKAYVIDPGKVMILNGDGEWVDFICCCHGGASMHGKVNMFVVKNEDGTTPEALGTKNHDVYIRGESTPCTKVYMCLYDLPPDFMDEAPIFSIQYYDVASGKTSWVSSEAVEAVTLQSPSAIGSSGIYLSKQTEGYCLTSGDKKIYLVPTDTDFFLQGPIVIGH